MADKPKKIKLTGNALVVAMQLAQVMDLHDQAQTKLDMKFDADSQALDKEWEPKLNEIMGKLAKELGIETERIMEYRLDMDYLEDFGLAFLTEQPYVCQGCGGDIIPEDA